jgi:hypothetical protein
MKEVMPIEIMAEAAILGFGVVAAGVGIALFIGEHMMNREIVKAE